MSATPPQLTAYRNAARNRLYAFYDPFPKEMGADESVHEFDADSTRWQQDFESRAIPAESGIAPAFLRGGYPPMRVDIIWYPQPEEYLVTRFLRSKFGKVLALPEYRKYYCHLCDERCCSLDWITNYLDDVINNTVAMLIEADLRPEVTRTQTNDYRTFLTHWKDSFGLPSSARRSVQLNLLRNPIDNTIRRMRGEERRHGVEQGHEPEMLDAMVAVGDLTDIEIGTLARAGIVCRKQHNGNLDDFLARVTTLTETERTIILLRHEDSCTFAEISVQMVLPLTTVYTRYRSGLAKLADHFGRDR